MSTVSGSFHHYSPTTNRHHQHFYRNPPEKKNIQEPVVLAPKKTCGNKFLVGIITSKTVKSPLSPLKFRNNFKNLAIPTFCESTSKTSSNTHRINGTGIFTYMYHKFKQHVGKYTIPGSYGIDCLNSPIKQSVPKWDYKSDNDQEFFQKEIKPSTSMPL